MATTTGLVQHLSIGERFTCALIGPSPAITELLFISIPSGDTATQSAFKTVMIDALAQALVSRREVTAHHADNNARIDALNLR